VLTVLLIPGDAEQSSAKDRPRPVPIAEASAVSAPPHACGRAPASRSCGHRAADSWSSAPPNVQSQALAGASTPPGPPFGSIHGRQFQLIKALFPAIALRRRPRRDGPGASLTSRRCRPASVQRTVSPAGVCAAAPRRRRIKGCGSRSAVQCGGRRRIHDAGRHADGRWWRR